MCVRAFAFLNSSHPFLCDMVCGYCPVSLAVARCCQWTIGYHWTFNFDFQINQIDRVSERPRHTFQFASMSYMMIMDGFVKSKLICWPIDVPLSISKGIRFFFLLLDLLLHFSVESYLEPYATTPKKMNAERILFILFTYSEKEFVCSCEQMFQSNNGL